MSSERPVFDPSRMAARENPALAARSMTVSQLNAMVKRVLGGALPGTIHLLGQLSNVSRPSSGHLYFTIKDDRSEVRAVMWKSAAAGLKFKIEDGLEVIATGSVDVYEPRGQYQFQVRKLEPKGVGDLELAFRQLQERLGREGLFDADRKKPIPRYPRRIGVVTSPTGAAIQDILHTLRRRFPCLEVLIYPVRVQGEGAALEIAGAIARLNEHAAALGGIDVLIVGRGGGSLEDLWAFNEEVVARAVYGSAIPVISGVGHEIDLTITDLVADLRAPTPTAAAEMAVPRLTDVLESLENCESRLRRVARHHLEIARSRIESLSRAELFRSPGELVRRREQRVDELSGCLERGLLHLVGDARRRLHELQITLASVRPAVLVHHRQTRLAVLDHRIQAAIQRRWRDAERNLEHADRKLHGAAPVRRMSVETEKLRQYESRLARGTLQRLTLLKAGLENLAGRIEATSYRRTLARGFSVTWNAERREIIRDPAQAPPGQVVITETAAGDFRSRVE
jgi:exodeoxyribonuclease VII large subunit